MNIMLLASAYNGMCQRVHRELEADGHRVSIELGAGEEQILASVQAFQPDLILCPFLKHPVPESVWRNYLCLIVHPGIEGDRGPSSLDWAITRNWDYWGVTLLQAEAEMDAGPIWATREFPLRNAAKASVYRREVINAAVDMIRELVADWVYQAQREPRPLDYSRPEVKGRLMPLMRKDDRQINWQDHTAAEIAQIINAADGFPGVLVTLEGTRVYLYGARVENRGHQATPGSLLGHRQGAICFAARDGAVWVRQLKLAPQGEKHFFKLPAWQVITQLMPQVPAFAGLPVLDSREQEDIRVEVEGAVAYISFDFYNGAMNTEQCLALQACVRQVARREGVRVIALLGGEDFWSNGIHLNCIEAAADPALESWRNINAIDDLVETLLHLEDVVTLAALRCNAGAGGAIMPLACDKVIAREGVVLNPHYLTMGLYGSEYWTYLLPRRVGQAQAQRLIKGCLPVLAREAADLGMVDQVLAEDWETYHHQLRQVCQELAKPEMLEPLLIHKRAQRLADEAVQPLASYRQAELRHMKACFDDPESDYHRLRRNFVYKAPCNQTPARLVYHPQDQTQAQFA